MIDTILELLAQDKYIGVSENIDIAKGKYKIPKTIKEKKEQLKREKAWQKR
jgi:hypothetical protein|tara:strand:- start:686 stop:838 length:153 start_codon:yes stop_codon:yes gene_type:complete